MSPAPIALFAYNRPIHTKQTVLALEHNKLSEQSDLIIFCDGAKNQKAEQPVNAVREYVRTITHFKSVNIIERESNVGLANNIIDGVTRVVDEYGKIIVLEDDLVTSPHFLSYMNEALNKYENEEKVVCIHGYVKPVAGKLPETFFLKGADCWGWATWKRGWDIFEPDGKKLRDILVKNNLTREFDYEGSYPFTKMLSDQIQGINNSWAVRWYASAFIRNKLTLYPGRSLVQNIGNDGSGVHSGVSNLFDTTLAVTPINIDNIPVEVNSACRSVLIDFYNSIKPGFIKKMYQNLKLTAKNVIYGKHL